MSDDPEYDRLCDAAKSARDAYTLACAVLDHTWAETQRSHENWLNMREGYAWGEGDMSIELLSMASEINNGHLRDLVEHGRARDAAKVAVEQAEKALQNRYELRRDADGKIRRYRKEAE